MGMPRVDMLCILAKSFARPATTHHKPNNPATHPAQQRSTKMVKTKEKDAEGKAVKAPSKSRSEKAGLSFPVSKLNRHLRDAHRTKRVGAGSPVYLAAVLEYAAAEVLELAGADLGKRKRISPSDVMRAIRNDEELNQLLGGCAIFTTDKVKNVTQAVVFKPTTKTEE